MESATMTQEAVEKLDPQKLMRLIYDYANTIASRDCNSRKIKQWMKYDIQADELCAQIQEQIGAHD